MYTLSKAVPYIEQAHKLAVGLERKTITYRPDSPSKFARIELELQGERQFLLFYFINNILVIPTVGAAQLLKLASTATVAMNLTKLNVAHFMLRLRTRRLVAAPQPLKNVKSPEKFAETTHQILAKCFSREVTPGEALTGPMTASCFLAL
jgi:hypothetical protein